MCVCWQAAWSIVVGCHSDAISSPIKAQVGGWQGIYLCVRELYISWPQLQHRVLSLHSEKCVCMCVFFDGVKEEERHESTAILWQQAGGFEALIARSHRGDVLEWVSECMCVSETETGKEGYNILVIKHETKIWHFQFIVGMHKNETPSYLNHFKWRLPGRKKKNPNNILSWFPESKHP